MLVPFWFWVRFGSAIKIKNKLNKCPLLEKIGDRTIIFGDLTKLF